MDSSCSVDSEGVSSEETQQSSTYKESTSETVTTVNTMPSVSLDDGFYLVGNLGGKSIWSPDKLNKSMCFSLKDSMKGIYALNWTFEEGDEIKIAFISDGKITQWYPEGVGNNYIIDSDHTGKKTIYFRPDGKGGAAWWDNKSGNYFLVSETETSSSEKDPVCGDADKDGIVTISDTNCIKNYLALNEVKSFSPEAADVNKNGHTDITDATLIQQWLSHFSIPYNIGK